MHRPLPRRQRAEAFMNPAESPVVSGGAPTPQPAPAPQEFEAMLEAAYGPSIWESADGVKVPEDAWEYHIRKSLNDAAYQNLEYVPYCSTMPVQQTCTDPKFMWKKKERH